MVRPNPQRNEIFLATKFGAFNLQGNPQDGPNSKPSYVKSTVQRSLATLGVDHIDQYYQHRVDASVPIEVVLEALREFVEAGKIRYLGLSEASPDTLRRAKAVPGLGDKLIAVQMEYNPFTLDIEKNGFADVAEEPGVSVVAYSPPARGLLTGRFRSRADFPEDDLRLILPRWSEENFPKNLVVVDKLKELSDKCGATPSQITLAWILAEHSTWVPIPGSRTAERVEENGNAALLTLAPEAMKEIRTLTENAEVTGPRNRTHLAWLKASLEGDSLPLAEWKSE